MTSRYQFSALDGLSEFIISAETMEEAAAMAITSPTWFDEYKVINLDTGVVLLPKE